MKGVKDGESGKEKQQRITIYDRLRKIPAIGIVFALLSAFFTSTVFLVVKLVNDYHAIETLVVRSVIQSVLYLSFILVTRTSFRPAKGEHLYFLVRCIFGMVSMICCVLSLRLIPLGDSSAIIYSSPVFIVVVARIFLNEKCDILNIIALFVTGAGVVLITKPSFLFPDKDVIKEEHRLAGCLLAVGSAFCGACAFVSIRKLQNTSSSVVIFWFSLFTAFIASIVLVSINELKMVYGLRNMILLLAIGLCGTFDQLCLTLAFKLEEAGPVSLARTLSTVIAYVYQIFVLNEEHEWSSLVGASIVVLSVVTIALRKWYLAKKSQNEKKSSGVSSLDVNVESISENSEKVDIKNQSKVVTNIN